MSWSGGPWSGRFGFWFGREGFAQEDVKFSNAQLVWLCCCRFRISPPSHCPIQEVERRIQLLCICIIGPCFWGGSLVENPVVIDSRKEDTWDTLCSLPLGSYGMCPNHPCAHTCLLNSFPGFGKQSFLVPKCSSFFPRHSGLPVFWTFSSFFLFSSLVACGNNIYIRHIW